MKRYLLDGAALAILGLAAAPLIAQTQTTTSSSSSGYVQTSKIIGTKVKTAQGEEVGVIKDVVLDRSNGCMAYTVLSAGGAGNRVTGGGKLLAVPWSVYSVSPDISYLTVRVDRDRIYNAPVFEYSRIGDVAFTNNVYSAFGLSGGVGTSSASTTSGATTQAQTNANASPSVAAETSATPSAGMTPSTAASPRASAAASAAAAASASTSPLKSGRAKGGMTPSSASSRDRVDTAPLRHNEAESEEPTGSPSTSVSKGSKKSTRTEKATSSTGEESAETGASPAAKKSSKKKSTTEGTETAPTPDGEQE